MSEVVLGLLSSKTSDLDDEERVYKLLEEASKIIPKERLYLSHQCGFASCDSGNELAIPQQWAKIKQGQEIAEKVLVLSHFLLFVHKSPAIWQGFYLFVNQS